MPVPVILSVAAGISYWLLRRRPAKSGHVEEVTYELDGSLPDPVRERVLELLQAACVTPESRVPLRELAKVLSVAYPHTAHSLRRRLWELGGCQGPVPEFGTLPLGDARVTGYEPTRDYTSGPLGYGTGPDGLDRGMPESTVRQVRVRLGESPARVHPETSYPGVLAAFADDLDSKAFAVAAETIRSKANYCKGQIRAKGGADLVAFTYRLDSSLPLDVREFVEWCLDNNRRPEQLEAVASHFGRGYPWTSYQLRHRANQLRVGTI
jgi:hypothetical protein